MVQVYVTGTLVAVEDTSWQGRNGVVAESTAVVRDDELHTYHRVKLAREVPVGEVKFFVDTDVVVRCRATAKAGGRHGAWLDLWGGVVTANGG